jgi:hypothetical protein
MLSNNSATTTATPRRPERAGERGGALAMAMIVLALISVVAIAVLATVSNEARIAGSDLRRTQTCYAAASEIERMTSDFSALYSTTARPSAQQITDIRDNHPQSLISDGFGFSNPVPVLGEDTTRLADMRTAQKITDNSYPRVTIPSGPFAGLMATVAPWRVNLTATHTATGTQCQLERDINNYLIPLFQFGMFTDGDMELHPGPQFTFNGRVHANGNMYLNGNVKFLDKVTTANELVRDVVRNGKVKLDSNYVTVQVGSIEVPLTKGSVNNGPNLSGATQGKRGFFLDSPDGTINTAWDSTSVAAASIPAGSTTGIANQFGGQVQTRTTGAAPLLLPLQLDGNPTREIIKRALSTDSSVLSDSRYHSKAQIRVLLDDESVPAGMVGGIPTGKGVSLSSFNPIRLPNLSLSSGGGRALWVVDDDGNYTTTSTNAIKQGGSSTRADTVRGVRSVAATSAAPDNVTIPAGSGVTGKILVEIVPASSTANPSPTPIDVTKEILSMGMTEGEPNAIVMLQRPLWAAFTQGSRDSNGLNDYLTYILNNTTIGADGEIDTTAVVQDTTNGFLTSLTDDGGKKRADAPPRLTDTDFWNAIVPINLYNVREGRINTTLGANAVYERGITNIVEINMRNFARWVDGVYDNNLLKGTNAVSTNIDPADGYIVYVSDRRGDKVKTEKIGTTNYDMTNGLVDNEDIYGPNDTLDPGEDVIDAGKTGNGTAKKDTLQKDTTELPDPATSVIGTGADWNARLARAKAVAAWTNPSNYFRRALRLTNAEDLQITGNTGKLSQTKGITVATENMVYIWGNYNTTGITCQPAGGSTLNDPSLLCNYAGNQVPTSIVADAFFPLSRTWFDGVSALFPDDLSKRKADRNLPTGLFLTQETSVRAAIISGNNLSALDGQPDAGNSSTNESRLCGGMHNFPRFLESWSDRWNFVGSLVPLFHSTQALGPYNSSSSIYGAPIRNWAFDDSFRNPNRLPPGTPMFQYIEPTGFKQTL